MSRPSRVPHPSSTPPVLQTLQRRAMAMADGGHVGRELLGVTPSTNKKVKIEDRTNRMDGQTDCQKQPCIEVRAL